MVEGLYLHIINVIEAMARGMERSPGDYVTWSEPKLRDALLVAAMHYHGQATGETFNKKGKTDILVRYADRNLFIGECKWWSGAKAFTMSTESEISALDQLLSYSTWRDAKLALVVFIRQKNIDGVIASAREAVEAHSSFIRWEPPGRGNHPRPRQADWRREPLRRPSDGLRSPARIERRHDLGSRRG